MTLAKALNPQICFTFGNVLDLNEKAAEDATFRRVVWQEKKETVWDDREALIGFVLEIFEQLRKIWSKIDDYLPWRMYL